MKDIISFSVSLLDLDDSKYTHSLYFILLFHVVISLWAIFWMNSFVHRRQLVEIIKGDKTSSIIYAQLWAGIHQERIRNSIFIRDKINKKQML